jgi:hypothetical protein
VLIGFDGIVVFIKASRPMKNFQSDDFTRENNSVPVVEQLRQFWLSKLAEYKEISNITREVIVNWLLGSDTERYELLIPEQLKNATAAMDYRWRILHKSYLGLSQEKTYRNLITRLGRLVTLQLKIKAWISTSRDRQRKALDVLSDLLNELLQHDKYIQQQMSFIATLTRDGSLKNALLFAVTEEYCFRPIQKQPLIVYRFITYMRYSERAGLTQVPSGNNVRFVSSDVATADNDNYFSLFDNAAVAKYQEELELEEQMFLRLEVQAKFVEYLRANLGEDAVSWFELYLQGKSPSEIAKMLDKPVRRVYQLRETIKYHAMLVFTLKEGPELVQAWLRCPYGN